jgi:radical SAM superfamily enzyme YgiQ (UPF0313 family)
VVGGYDPSLAPEAWADGTADFIVRGEGELTFRELLRPLEACGGFEGVRGAQAGMWTGKRSELLAGLLEGKSLAKAARDAAIPYRTAQKWSILPEFEAAYGKQVAVRQRMIERRVEVAASVAVKTIFEKARDGNIDAARAALVAFGRQVAPAGG